MHIRVIVHWYLLEGAAASLNSSWSNAQASGSSQERREIEKEKEKEK